jgi:hypothetical protein
MGLACPAAFSGISPSKAGLLGSKLTLQAARLQPSFKSNKLLNLRYLFTVRPPWHVPRLEAKMVTTNGIQHHPPERGGIEVEQRLGSNAAWLSTLR